MDQLVNDNFTQNDWIQHDIISEIYILNKQGADTAHAIIPTKYKKYTSTTILKYSNVLAKVNKSPYGCLLNMMPHDATSITIRVHTITLSDISHKQK